MPFEQRSFFYKKDIDLALMNKACKKIIGKKDFTSFSKANTQTHTNICEIYRAEWTYEKQMICFTIQANRFLRNMVRAIVGTMLLVGEKKISPDEISNIVKKKNRGFLTPMNMGMLGVSFLSILERVIENRFFIKTVFWI